jgi:glutamyl-Q tRNA(Asp) synthetase
MRGGGKTGRLGLIYPAFESRAEIARLVAQRETEATWPRDPDGAPLYPGAAKSLAPDERDRLIAQGTPYALRLDMAAAVPTRARFDLDRAWRRSGGELGTVIARPEAWGDVILARKETPTSYHLSVVVDDALQGVTEVVRGATCSGRPACTFCCSICLGYRNRSIGITGW